MSDWQGIESAPKDGTLFIAWLRYAGGDEEFAVLSWDGVRPQFPWRLGSNCFCDRVAENIPTHWMPLPPPPGAKDESAT